MSNENGLPGRRNSLVRAGVVLLCAAATLACMGGRPPSRTAPRGETIQSLKAIYGDDACSARPSRTGQVTWKVTAGGGTWSVPVWIPPGTGPRKAVILLHGHGGTGPGIVKSSQYERIAKENGAILVAPTAEFSRDGVRGTEIWNNGRYSASERNFPRDDVAFLDFVADALERDACVEDVLGTGFSDGSAMIMAWDCQSERHPDAMVLAASLLMIPESRCVKKRPVPMRLYMGKLDPRYTGGERDHEEAPSAAETTAIFARMNKCEDGTRSRQESPRTTCEAYQGCREPAELCAIDRFGHAWPKPPAADVDAAADGYAWFLERVGRGRR